MSTFNVNPPKHPSTPNQVAYMGALYRNLEQNRSAAYQVLAQIPYGKVSLFDIHHAWRDLVDSADGKLNPKDQKLVAQLMLHQAHFVMAESGSRLPVIGNPLADSLGGGMHGTLLLLLKQNPEMARLPEVRETLMIVRVAPKSFPLDARDQQRLQHHP
jgi:hypothetical protein